MKYYFLDTSAYSDITTEIIQPDPKVWQEEHYQSEMSYHEHTDFDPIFGELLLKVTEKKATKTPTDFLAAAGLYGGMGYVMSAKAKSIFEQFKLPEHRFYALPAYTLEATGEPFQYYYLHILVADDNYDFIDFGNSVFQIDFWEPEPDGRSEEFRFDNAQEMEESYQEHWMPDNLLYEKEIALSEAFRKESPDLFQINYVFDRFVISENLKNALEENGINGLKNFDENMPRIKGNSVENSSEKPTEEMVEKEPLAPKNLDEAMQKLDFIFAEMDAEDDAVYDYGQEIDAALEFLSRTDNPIKPIFAYFEQHPDAIHGAPGPFVHYLETFHDKGLEAELVASLERNPTIEAMNMAYRIARQESNQERGKYVAILENIAKNNQDEYIAQNAQDCLDDL